MLASSVDIEEAGSEPYQTAHMNKIFQEGFSFSGFERDHLYLSVLGERFIDISGLSGLDSVTDARGAAYGDFDNDGDYDVLLTTLQGQVHHLFRNNVGTDAGFIRVSLEGTESGRDAFGAEVRVRTSQGILTKVKLGGSGYVSQSDGRLLFGLGKDGAAESITVRWPSGQVQRFAGPVASGSSVKVTEGAQELVYLEERRFSLPDPVRGNALVLSALRPRQGDAFPAIALRDLHGGRIDFGRLREEGNAYLVNLWATWCAPCRQEMPELEKLYPELTAAGIRLVGISLDTESALDRIPSFLQRLGITYPVYTLEVGALPELFQGDQLVVPVSFVVDETGRIAQILTGWSSETEQAIRGLISRKGTEGTQDR